MMDLAILLSISLAVTALLGLLLVGFVWVPWLIGLVLLVLLIALMKVTGSDEQQTVVSATQAGDSVVQQGQKIADDEAFALSPDDPIMVYRGAKYKRSPETEQSLPPTVIQGKYRGQPWSR